MENVDIENLDFKGKNYGFHFTPQINESGFEKTGLEARILLENLVKKQFLKYSFLMELMEH